MSEYRFEDCDGAEAPAQPPASAAVSTASPSLSGPEAPGSTGDDEVSPVSEIETIRRTLEVPMERRQVGGSPKDDKVGSMSGNKGRRL